MSIEGMPGNADADLNISPVSQPLNSAQIACRRSSKKDKDKDKALSYTKETINQNSSSVIDQPQKINDKIPGNYAECVRELRKLVAVAD